jgi:hypothetical protein
LPDGIFYNLGKVWKALQWKMLVFLWPVCLFYGQIVYFMVIWCILWSNDHKIFIQYIFSFGMLYREKSGNPACHNSTRGYVRQRNINFPSLHTKSYNSVTFCRNFFAGRYVFISLVRVCKHWCRHTFTMRKNLRFFASLKLRPIR